MLFVHEVDVSRVALAYFGVPWCSFDGTGGADSMQFRTSGHLAVGEGLYGQIWAAWALGTRIESFELRSLSNFPSFPILCPGAASEVWLLRCLALEPFVESKLLLL